jgi:hypothetical protein
MTAILGLLKFCDELAILLVQMFGKGGGVHGRCLRVAGKPSRNPIGIVELRD